MSPAQYVRRGAEVINAPLITASSSFRVEVPLASRSAQRPATRLSRRSGRRSEGALHERSDKSLDDLARMFNSQIRGWINYYGRTLNRLSTRPCDTSTGSWLGGRIGSSSPCDGTNGAHSYGSTASRGISHNCSPIRGFCKGAAEQWELESLGRSEQGAASGYPALKLRQSVTVWEQ
jgi:hypothetical protein